MKTDNKTRQSQINHYKKLFDKYKGTPMAVSSESEAHKSLRFTKISQIFLNENKIQVHDVGMGLGDYYEYLKKTFPNKIIEYSGSEIVEEYFSETKTKFPESEFYLRDIAEKPGEEKYDYVILSGVFHQRRDSTIGEWENFAQNIIRNSFKMCNKGIAFNFISPFVDFYQTEVYYCNLPKLINFINDDLSRFFTLNHNYPLFEFTMFVYKEEYIKSLYKEKEFQKYFKI